MGWVNRQDTASELYAVLRPQDAEKVFIRKEFFMQYETSYHVLHLYCSEYKRFCINLVKDISFILSYSLLLRPIRRVITTVHVWQRTTT